MNHHILRIKNLKQVKVELSSDRKKKIIRNPIAKPLNCNIVNFATLNFRASHYKLLRCSAVQLPRLENSLKILPKIVKVSLKRQTLKTETKISRKVANMCKRDCYIFIWSLHPKSREMLIRSTLDPYTFHWVKVNMSLK